MKKTLINIIIAFALVYSASALWNQDCTQQIGHGWYLCNWENPSYYGWNKAADKALDGCYNDCYVAWEGVGYDCYDYSRDATLTLGDKDFTTSMINIVHLDGKTDSSWQLFDNEDNIVCEFVDPQIGGHGNDWVETNCPVEFFGVKDFTFHPTAEKPSEDCDEYGQVAVKKVTWEAENPIPEFSLIAGSIAIAGAVAAMVYFRRK